MTTDTDSATLARIEANVSTISNQLGVLVGRVVSTETRLTDAESRMNRNSDRARQPSNADLAQDARIAEEIVARQELAAKVDTMLAIAVRLDKVTSNPTVKVLAGMIMTALATWLATHGGYLK